MKILTTPLYSLPPPRALTISVLAGASPGTIPASLGNLTWMVALNLANNRLSGGFGRIPQYLYSKYECMVTNLQESK